jgi:hypothetical protein
MHVDERRTMPRSPFSFSAYLLAGLIAPITSLVLGCSGEGAAHASPPDGTNAMQTPEAMPVAPPAPSDAPPTPAAPPPATRAPSAPKKPAPGADAGAPGASTPDASGPAEASVDGAAPVAPVGPSMAPDETWTWLPVDGTQCADGTPTGIAINPTKKSSRVVVIFQWGGACWDSMTCDVLKFADTGGYGELEFQKALKLFPPSGTPVDRNDVDNPFKDDNFVFVPYCTADIHGGSHVSTYGSHVVHHHGFDNVTADLAELVKMFPDPERVVVSGLSAGGFGAAYNFWRFKEAFPKAKAFLVDDSGPPLPAPYAPEKLTETWREAWNLDATLPPDCESCKTHFEAFFDHYATKYPDARYGLISYRSDIVISTFYGIGPTAFGPALDLLESLEFSARPQFHVFYIDGLLHTTTGMPRGRTSRPDPARRPR